MKLKRAQYVSSIWCKSDLARPTQHLDKTKYGWDLTGRKYEVVWYRGSSLPELMTEVDYTTEGESDCESIGENNLYSDDSEDSED